MAIVIFIFYKAKVRLTVILLGVALLLSWSEKIVPVASLKPYERNPRTISEQQFKILVEGLERLGQFSPLGVNADLTIWGGHQRIKGFQKLGWDKVRVSIPDRQLTDEEFEEAMMRSNINNGAFDWEMVTNDFDKNKLEKWGMNHSFFKDPQNFDPASSDDQGTLGEIAPKFVTCPHCGGTFDSRENRAKG